jgi:hypothetical protein
MEGLSVHRHVQCKAFPPQKKKGGTGKKGTGENQRCSMLGIVLHPPCEKDEAREMGCDWDEQERISLICFHPHRQHKNMSQIMCIVLCPDSQLAALSRKLGVKRSKTLR